MSQEILYTSAPKGLRPGSSGFCTVVSTSGMAVNLAERLESLSGYRHLYGPYEAGVNPVNFSHLRLSVGGQRFHVLSRIADAGLDYTKRTNKIAHHIAFTHRELVGNQSGPAYLMRKQDFFVTAWDGKVATIAEVDRSCDEEVEARRCRAWQAAAGDEGWAGELAKGALAGKRPQSVLFSEETDPLELVAEALALLPPHKRWGVTFNTYFTKLPAGVDCLWRFIPDKTPEAAALRRDPHSGAIDLCSQLGKAPDSEWAVAARTGNACYAQEEKISATLSRKGPISKPIDVEKRSRDTVASAKIYDLEPLQPSQQRQVVRAPPSSSARSFPISYFIAITILLAVVAIGLVALKLTMTREMDSASIAGAGGLSESDGNSKRPAEQTSVPSTVPQNDDLANESSSADEAAELARSEEIRQHLNQDRPETSAPERSSAALGSIAEDQPTSADAQLEQPNDYRAPFEDIRTKEGQLFLPARRDPFSFQTIARVYASDPGTYALSLSQSEQENGQQLKVDREMSGDGTKYLLKRQGAGLWDTIGTFRLEGEELQFAWESWSASIANTKLRLSIDGLDQEVQLMLTAEATDPLQLRFDSAQYIQPLPIARSAFATYEVRLECPELSGVTYEPKGAVPKHETVSITFPIETRGPAEAFWIDVNLLPDQATLTFTPKANMRLLRAKQQVDEVVTKRLFGLPDIEFMEVERGVNDPTLNTLRAVCQQQLRALDEFAKRKERESDAEQELLQNNVQDAKQAVREAEEKLKSAKSDREVEQAEKELRKERQNHKNEQVRLRTPDVRREVLEELKQIARETIAWCDQVERMFATIHNDGRLHLRLRSEDQELLKTVGWESVEAGGAAPSDGSSPTRGESEAMNGPRNRVSESGPQPKLQGGVQ